MKDGTMLMVVENGLIWLEIHLMMKLKQFIKWVKNPHQYKMSKNLRVKTSEFIDETLRFHLNLMVKLIMVLKEIHLASALLSK